MSSTNSDARQDAPDCGLARGVLIALPLAVALWAPVVWFVLEAAGWPLP